MVSVVFREETKRMSRAEVGRKRREADLWKTKCSQDQKLEEVKGDGDSSEKYINVKYNKKCKNKEGDVGYGVEHSDNTDYS